MNARRDHGLEVAIVVGNPKEHSRTREAAVLLAEALVGDSPRGTTVIELAALGPSLLGWDDPAVAAAKQAIVGAPLAIFASPTFKASYTGLLKLLLDQLPGGTGLAGVVTIPLMLGASAQHALAVEHTLRPVLTELGALTLPGLFLIDETFRSDDAIELYADRWRDTVRRLIAP